MKNYKQLERHIKGIANHRRIAIMVLLQKQPNLTLDQISESLDCNPKTISGHTNRLVVSGLLNKKYKSQFVTHFLSPYGEKAVKFLKDF